MSNLTAERKKELFKQYGASETNSGSAEAQIAMFTERIAHITDHLKANKKDYSSTRALVTLVGKRRSLLNYLAKKDIQNYRSLIERLNLRK
ncbi:MAG: 30S ribosomal protein S15 [Chitinophagales bacterium]|nr:30S ribosomal protein S15 [Chitinophagales bacterium]